MLDLFKEQVDVDSLVFELYHKHPDYLNHQREPAYLDLTLKLAVDPVQLALRCLDNLNLAINVLASLRARLKNLCNLLISLACERHREHTMRVCFLRACIEGLCWSEVVCIASQVSA